MNMFPLINCIEFLEHTQVLDVEGNYIILVECLQAPDIQRLTEIIPIAHGQLMFQ